MTDLPALLQSLTDYEKTPAGGAAARVFHLDRIREALDRAGNPHRGLRCVHIAGTKGKGSTAAMIAAILRAAGRRVGLFTSPHLVSFRERIRVAGTPIPEADLLALLAEVAPIIAAMRARPLGPPTFFEATTLLGLLWFARQGVDIAVLETGLGGRLDATNVVTPLVAVLTTIARDHMAELGDSLAAIAAEKVGIIKAGVPVVSAPQAPAPAEIIAATAAAGASPLVRVGTEVQVTAHAPLRGSAERFSIAGRLATYADLTCPLLGAHQAINAGVAVGAAECLREAGEPVEATALRDGLARVQWPGRLQIVSREPLLLLDGAHDPVSVSALLAALDRHFPGRPRRFILGFARDKQWEAMLAQFAAGASALYLTAAASPRAVPPDALAAATPPGVPTRICATLPAALAAARAEGAPGDLRCVTGSLYLVGDALRALG